MSGARRRHWIPCTHVCRYLGGRGQEKAPDPMELVLKMVVTCLMWILGFEFRPSARTVSHFSSTPLTAFALFHLVILSFSKGLSCFLSVKNGAWHL